MSDIFDELSGAGTDIFDELAPSMTPEEEFVSSQPQPGSQKLDQMAEEFIRADYGGPE